MYASVGAIFPDPALVFAAAALDNWSFRASFAFDVIDRRDGDERTGFLPTPFLAPIRNEGVDEVGRRLRPASTLCIIVAR